MGSIERFSANVSQRQISGVGTLIVDGRSDQPQGLTLTLYVNGGMAVIGTAAALDVYQLADDLTSALNCLWLTVRDWTAARPERSRGDVDEIRSLSSRLLDLLLPRAAARERELFIQGLRSCRIVQVKSAGATSRIPWNLLWLDELGCWSGEVAMFRRPYPILRASREIDHFGKPGCSLLGYAEDDRLASARADLMGQRVRHEEYWAADDLVEDGRGQVDTLEVLRPGKLSGEDADLLHQWLARRRDLLHFNCHSDPPKSGGAVEFGLRNKAIADTGHMQFVPPGSVVFLNICRSAVHPKNDDLGLTAALHKRSARGACGTTHAIGDRFATLFVRMLYKQLRLNQFSLFEAVRATQRKLTKRLAHPMALFYVFEGDPDLIVGER